MKKLYFFLIAIFVFLQFIKTSSAQQSVQYALNPQNVKVLTEKGDTMLNPWAGGLEIPQFSNIDLNNDGLQDLFVFDRVGNKALTYISLGKGIFKYAPEYEAYFPKIVHWVFLIDYNKDGKPDIFTYEAGGVKVFRNESSGAEIRFRLVEEELHYFPAGEYLNILFSEKQLPAFVDVDGDGDLDIIKINSGQSHFELFRNMSYDKYKHYDSLEFVLTDECWGKFRQSEFSDMPILALPACGSSSGKAMHGGTTILALDVDGDGDLDILQSDNFSPLLVLVKNGKIHNGQQRHPVDSMIAVDTTFPNIATRPKLPGYLTSFYVDVNNDNIRDLLVVPQAGYTNLNQVLLYRNSGTDKSPVFTFAKNNFLQEHEIDLGQGAAPAFFDYDGDGLQDLVVGTAGNFRDNHHSADRLVLYKNIGTAQHAIFQKTNDDYLELSKLNLYTIVPAFGDITGDGKPDLILGNREGRLVYFRNTTAQGQAATFELENIFMQNIDVGDYSAPALADLDRDGLTDLIVGKKEGFINYYKNTGSATNPFFKLVTEEFGKINASAYSYDYSYNPDGTKKDSTKRYEHIGLASPVIADLNNDGKWDLVVGSNRGQTHIYMNIEDKLLKHFGRERQNFYNPLLEVNEEKNLGVATHPAVAFLNGDSLPDIMIGNERGGLNIYASMKMINSVTDSVPDAFVDTVKTTDINAIYCPEPPSPFIVFPNPASESLYINGQGENVEIQIFNMLGQRFYNNLFRNFSGDEKIDVSGLTKGVYLIRIRNNKGQPQVKQVVKW